MLLEKYSFGVGDRFARQAKAQLRAFQMAEQQGAIVTPVWNKSAREHKTIGSSPESVREAAQAAVRELGWARPFRVDADHIRLETVDAFLESSDFFTIDVAEAIGRDAGSEAVRAFVERHPELGGEMSVPGLSAPLSLARDFVERAAGKYLRAAEQAGRVFRHIESRKGVGGFIAEVSLDETDQPQSPPELLVVLAALADQGVRLQTIAPKFSGRFNKGVDYVGDVEQFEREFSDDLSVLAFAVVQYGLPASLKLSVHSGSDKFSLYAPMRRALKRSNAGLHLKTAGTTWLEEMIGLAESGGGALALAQEIYARAFEDRAALCEPYAEVIDIDSALLPSPAQVSAWSGEQFAAALRHDPSDAHNPEFNPHLRQLLHVGYAVAARMAPRYLAMLEEHEAQVSRNVTANLFERHLKPLFVG